MYFLNNSFISYIDNSNVIFLRFADNLNKKPEFAKMFAFKWIWWWLKIPFIDDEKLFDWIVLFLELCSNISQPLPIGTFLRFFLVINDNHRKKMSIRSVEDWLLEYYLSSCARWIGFRHRYTIQVRARYFFSSS